MGPWLRKNLTARGFGRLALLLVVLGLASGGCERTPPDPLLTAVRSIHPRNMDAIGKQLSADAMGGRYYASPEADSSVALILRTLDAANIQQVSSADAVLASRPASFTHHFSVFHYRLGRRNRFAVRQDHQTQHAQLGQDYLPLLFSSDGELTARLKHLDRPISQLTAADAASLRDRIVVVGEDALEGWEHDNLEGALYGSVRELATLGAAAVVFVEIENWLHLDAVTYPSHLPPAQLQAAESVQGERRNLHPDRLSIAAQARVWRHGIERTIPALVVRPGWSQWLKDGTEVGMTIELVPEASLGQNVLVGFGGHGDHGELLLLTAHYDNAGINRNGEILNGADDNASGVAALLGIAEALSHVHADLERSVLLAFLSAELQGAHGGEMLLHDLPLLFRTMHPSALMALDAIGRNGPDVVRIRAGSEYPAIVRLLERHNRREELHAPPLVLEASETLQAGTRMQSLPGNHAHENTQALFLRAGIPAVLLNDGLDPRLYEHPEDVWEHVDSKKIARVARLVFLAVYELATTQEPTAVPARSRP